MDRAGGIPAFEETQNYVAKILGGQQRPVPRSANLGPEGLPTRPEPRPFAGPAAEQRNAAVREALLREAGARPVMRPEGIAGLMR